MCGKGDDEHLDRRKSDVGQERRDGRQRVRHHLQVDQVRKDKGRAGRGEHGGRLVGEREGQPQEGRGAGKMRYHIDGHGNVETVDDLEFIPGA